MKNFPAETEKHLILPGAFGQLEAMTMCPQENMKPITAVICHPHPLYDGTMTNKVVHTLAKTCMKLEVKSVRFNFRGVGQSEGEYGEGVGETEDALAIVDWVKQVCPEDTIWMMGFSFGAYVAAKVASQIHPARLITVAPAVEHFDFESLPAMQCSWLIVQGEEDDIVPPDLVYRFAANQVPAPRLIRFPGVGHFFHGQLITLRDTLIKELSE